MHTNFTEVYTISNIEDLYFTYFNVIQYGADSSIQDKFYSSPVTNDTIFYPLSNSNAIYLSTILTESTITLDYIQNKSVIIEMNIVYDCVVKQSYCDPKFVFTVLSDEL